MSVINTNVNAIIARNAGAVNERSMTKAMQQLSTGKRINVAADDAAGLAISTKMTSQVRGLDQAVRNANDGIAMLQVAEGATVEMTNMLQRMRELAVQSRNDTNTDAERSYLNDEYTQLKSEINRIATTTQWNGQNILDGTGTIGEAHVGGTNGGIDLDFQVGANASQTITFNAVNFATTASGPTVATGSLTLDAADVGAELNGIKLGASGPFIALTTAEQLVGDAVTVGAATSSDWSNFAQTLQSKITAIAGYEDVTVTASSGYKLDFQKADGSNFSVTIGTYAATPAVSGASLGSGTYTFTTTDGVAATATTAGIFAKQDLNGDGDTTDSNELALSATGISTSTTAEYAIDVVDSALSNLNQQRSLMGAMINRLTYAADNLTNTSANVNAARSRVLDTDYASATTELARTQIIQQASTAMLAQANQGAQSVLSLLK